MINPTFVLEGNGLYCQKTGKLIELVDEYSSISLHLKNYKKAFECLHPRIIETHGRSKHLGYLIVLERRCAICHQELPNDGFEYSS